MNKLGIISRAVLLTGAILSLSALLAGGCTTRRSAPPECFDAGDCASEQGVPITCSNSGQCVEVECLSSTDCALGHYCDLEDEENTCILGCQDEGDCLAGEECSAEGQCQPYGCRSTVLDCDFGETCNEGTGACEVAEGLYCSSCSGLSTITDDNGTMFDPCDDVVLGDSECGGEGSFCLGSEDGSTFCAPHCDGPEDCPAGYSCTLIVRNPQAVCGETEPTILGQSCAPVESCNP